MISPLIFVHPPKKNEQHIYQQLSGNGKLLGVLLKFSDHLVRYVDKVRRWSFGPIFLSELLNGELSHIVQETYQNGAFRAFLRSHFVEKDTGHILTCFVARRRFKPFFILDVFLCQNAPDFILGIVLFDRIILFHVLWS
jgi:hypothetical protein